MPVLMWNAFWSSVTGLAKGWQETMLPIRVKVKDRRDSLANCVPDTHYRSLR
jgi:hypothetical protein